jgi:hypothetical protein
MYGRSSTWRTFWIGFAIRLLGVLLIWLGDGSDHLARKAVVVLGVALLVGGTAILRYLLIAGRSRQDAH